MVTIAIRARKLRYTYKEVKANLETILVCSYFIEHNFVLTSILLKWIALEYFLQVFFSFIYTYLFEEHFIMLFVSDANTPLHIVGTFPYILHNYTMCTY
jgi:hypothetical protein